MLPEDSISFYLESILGRFKQFKIEKLYASSFEDGDDARNRLNSPYSAQSYYGYNNKKDMYIYTVKFKLKQFRNKTWTLTKFDSSGKPMVDRLKKIMVTEHSTIHQFKIELIEYLEPITEFTLPNTISLTGWTGVQKLAWLSPDKMEFTSYNNNVVGKQGNVNFFEISIRVPKDVNHPKYLMLKQGIREEKLKKLRV